MGTVEKTVFLSYRRSHVAWALAVFQHLNRHGYDVFFDFEGLASGGFEQVIVQNIRARAHFLVLLTPTALAECDAPGDWLRREVAEALRSQRNIVPLMLEGFSFEAPEVRERLKGELALLARYNGLEVPAAYFEAAMVRLREKFLEVALEAVLHPVSRATRGTSNRMLASARRAQPVQPAQLSATGWFERGLQATTPEEKLHCYGQAIALDPHHAEAFTNRALILAQLRRFHEALPDVEAALRLRPNLFEARHCRGVIRANLADTTGALADFSAVIEGDPDHAVACFNRGHLREWQDDLAGALADFDEAIRRQPAYPEALYRRGVRRGHLGDSAGALADWSAAIALAPDHPEAHMRRAQMREEQGDLRGAIEDHGEQIRIDALAAHSLWLDRPYVHRGWLWQQLGEPEAARRDFDTALELNPANATASFNRAVLKRDADDIDGALADLAEAMRHAPGDPEAYEFRSELRAASGNTAGARRDRKRAEQLRQRAAAQAPAESGPEA
jgi:tetratricopeptide (TPR) repeat protein